MSLMKKYLVGKKIESIIFMFEMLKIEFYQGDVLTMYNKFSFSYKVQDFVNLVVKDVIFIEKNILKLVFGNNMFIEMSLKWNDYEGAEAFQLVCADGTYIVGQ